MAFRDSFESFCDLATEAAQTAAKKTKKLAEIAKANLSVYSEEDKIKKAYVELGKLYYRDYVVGEDLDEAEYLPWCQKIDESKETIADLRDYIEVLKTERVVYDETAEEVCEEEVTEDDFVVEIVPEQEALEDAEDSAE